MTPLLLFIALGIVVLIATEIHERRRGPRRNAQPQQRVSNGESGGGEHPNASSSQSMREVADGECCGTHLVCERETLLQTDARPEYYDDEELDTLAGIEPDAYTEAQYDAIRTVFNTLQEADVPGWCRSLQLRHIALPPDIREEALLIVRERRKS